MTERPRSRRTKLVWWATVATMAVIAVIFLLITKPWHVSAPAKRHPHATHHKTQSLAAGFYPLIKADLRPNTTATRR